MTDDATNGQATNGQEPQTTPRDAERRQQLIAFCTVGAIMLLSIVWFSWPKSTTTDDGKPRLVGPELQEEDLGPHKEPDDGGEIEVIEKGFGAIDSDSEEHRFSWGAMLANSSEESVARVELDVGLVDKDGQQLADDVDIPDAKVSELLPGAETGIGDVVSLDGSDVAELEITVESVEWWSVDDPNTRFHELSVSELSTGRETQEYRNGDRTDRLRIDFRLESQYDRIIRPAATALFRDEDGEILGASPPLDTDYDAVAPPGWSEQYIVVEYGPPKGTDEDTIEVFAYDYGAR